MPAPQSDYLEYAPLYDLSQEPWREDPVISVRTMATRLLGDAAGYKELQRLVDPTISEMGRLVMTAANLQGVTMGKVIVDGATGQHHKRRVLNQDGSETWVTVPLSGGRFNTFYLTDDVESLEAHDPPTPNKPQPVHFHPDVISACERVFHIFTDKPHSWESIQVGSQKRLKDYGRHTLNLLLGSQRGFITRRMIDLKDGRMLHWFETLISHAGDPSDRLYGAVVGDSNAPILDN